MGLGKGQREWSEVVMEIRQVLLHQRASRCLDLFYEPRGASRRVLSKESLNVVYVCMCIRIYELIHSNP